MKRKMTLLMALLLLFSTISASAATMYALDGRSIYVPSKEISAYKKVGWYTEPVMTVYAPDGRSHVIAKADYYDWKAVGWYKYPVLYMYAPDGRKAVVPVSDFGVWYNVGWSNLKGTRPYAEWLTDLTPVTKERIFDSTSSYIRYYNTGKTYNHGMWASGSSYSFLYDQNSIEHYLGKKYAFLSGTWGVAKGTNIEGSMVVKVYADGKKIYHSPIINAKSDPIDFTLDVRTCKYLKIKFVPLEDDCYNYDEFILGNLKLYRQ